MTCHEPLGATAGHPAHPGYSASCRWAAFDELWRAMPEPSQSQSQDDLSRAERLLTREREEASSQERRAPPHASASSRGLLLTPLLAWPLGAALDTNMHTHTHTHTHSLTHSRTHHPARAQALASKADKRDLETAVEELQAALLRV